MELGSKENSVIECSAGASRRKLIVKSSAAALIVALPIKTTWANSSSGCMVSGTLSGNQSAVCNSTGVNGLKPSTWRDSSDELLLTEWGAVYLIVPISKNNLVSLSSSSTFGEVLTNGKGKYKHLAAGYLNAASNRYPLTVTPKIYAGYLEEELSRDKQALIAALKETYIDY